MARDDIPAERIHVVHGGESSAGRYVLYWMQQAQRADFNHALELAVRRANERRLPVVVGFALDAGFPEANLRHFTFMTEGLRGTAQTLERRGIHFVLRAGVPEAVIPELAREAALLVMDRGYLRLQRQWRQAVADAVACPVVEVESDVVVPVEVASEREELAARTLRPKIRRNLERFLRPVATPPVAESAKSGAPAGLDPAAPKALLRGLRINRSVGPAPGWEGGAAAARQRLRAFVRHGLDRYAEGRNEPADNIASGLSPYLHFGQISPVEVALAVRERRSEAPDAVQAFLDELVVRRELSMNFVWHNPRYDQYEGVPAWARETLERHRGDPREATYTEEELAQGRTADPYWNAAQRQMVAGGKMHGYMRMYWGKRLIEWHRHPADAFRIALRLNNMYELDGRDANAFAGVAWCFGKHDQPWPEHPVFGKVRCMKPSGLERKFDMPRYLAANP